MWSIGWVSEKVENVQGKCRDLASVTLTCDFFVTRFHQERTFHLFCGKAIS